MNRLNWFLTAVCVIIAAGAARVGRGASAPGRPIRIAYVDLDRVAKNSAMVKQKVSAVEKDLREKQKLYQDKADELRRLRRQLATQSTVLTPAQVDKIKNRIKQLRDEMDYLQYQADRVLNNSSREIIEPVLDQVLAAVEQVAKKYQIDLVLRGDLVLFASDRVDLTDAVIRELDRSLGSSTSGVSPAKPPVPRSAVRSGAGKRTPRPSSRSGKTTRKPTLETGG